MEERDLTQVRQIILKQLKNKDVINLLTIEKVVVPKICEHSIVTAMLATLIAIKKDFDEETVNKIARGALVHDIGKLMIKREVLEKKGRLNKDEFEEIKKHCIYGDLALTNLKSDMVKEIAKYHHEKLDGSGYPTGMTDIPLYVQCVTVADMYEAMTSKRSYKNSYEHARTMRNLYEDVEKGKISSDLVNTIANHSMLEDYATIKKEFLKEMEEEIRKELNRRFA